MPMPTKTFTDVFEQDFLMSEGPGRLSRDQAILLASADVKPSGLVLGQITASGKYVILAPAAGDGSQNAAAILLARQKESAAADQRVTIISRLAELRDLALTWPPGITVNQKAAAIVQLAAKMLIVRA